MSRILDLDALASAPTRHQPYPHFIVEKSLSEPFLEGVLADFPEINAGGSFALSEVDPGPRFNEFIEELHGREFRELIASKLDVDLGDRPMVITLRGISRAKDGRIHTDSKSKMATILLYFNQNWQADTGCLRLLKSNNMDDIAEEVVPNAGAMIAFKVTDNCWHGYPAYEGVRQSMQINFVEDDKAANKHGRRHSWTAKLKKLFS